MAQTEREQFYLRRLIGDDTSPYAVAGCTWGVRLLRLTICTALIGALFGKYLFALLRMSSVAG